jgi:hypothetical protein
MTANHDGGAAMFILIILWKELRTHVNEFYRARE